MPTGYGVEAWLTDRYVPGRLVRGALVVAQAQYRRLTTPFGTLADVNGDPYPYGFDVSGYIGHVGIERAALTLGGMVKNEISKDDRVSTVDVVVTQARDAAGQDYITISVMSTLADSGETFSLTLEASAAALTLTGITT